MDPQTKSFIYDICLYI